MRLPLLHALRVPRASAMAAAPSPRRSGSWLAHSSPARRDRDESPTPGSRSGSLSPATATAHDSAPAYSASPSRSRKRMSSPDASCDLEPRKRFREDSSSSHRSSRPTHDRQRPYAFDSEPAYHKEAPLTDEFGRALRRDSHSRSPDRHDYRSYSPKYTRHSPTYTPASWPTYNSAYATEYETATPGSWRHTGTDDNRIYRSNGTNHHESPPFEPSPITQPRLSHAPVPEPPVPSEEYLAEVNVPSEFVEPMSAPRKLLILDLNGTLLFRSKATGTSRQRHVRPRPYMPAFLQYLFYRDTNYDVMVWSSAQPVNVQDMVRKAFGDTRSQLVAIWDRTYFNLSKADYHQKSVTLKDLRKPWKFLARQGHEEDCQTHSSATTLLLDDSTVKASLQPYNHLCVTEFDEAAAKHERLLSELEQMRLQSRVPREDEKEKKKKKRQQREEGLLSATLGENGEPKGHEDMLLAVIGVLDRLRHETNVANWIKNGGLWAVEQPASATAKLPSPVSAPSLVAEASSPRPDSLASTPREGSPAPLLPSSSQIIEPPEARNETSAAASPLAVAPSPPAITEESATHAAAAPSPPAEPVGNDREVDPLQQLDKQAAQPMWFEDKENYRHWVESGRAALHRLSIHVPVSASTNAHDDPDAEPLL